MNKRYAYRLKGTPGRVTGDYSSKAPATSALYDHIDYLRQKDDRAAWFAASRSERKQIVKGIAADDYELITYVLVEEPELTSLQESAAWLGHLENAGVDNWEGISFAYELKREEEGEEE